MTKTMIINAIISISNLSEKDLKNKRKAELESLLVQLEADQKLEEKEEETIVEEKKEDEVVVVEDIYKALCKVYTEASLVKGKKLFYKGTNVGTDDYLVVKDNLWKHTIKVIDYNDRTPEKIQEVIDHMVELGLITSYTRERTFIVLSIDKLDDDAKAKINEMVKAKDLGYQYLENKTKIKLISKTDTGKKEINDTYGPSVCYKATKDQMNMMYRLSR